MQRLTAVPQTTAPDYNRLGGLEPTVTVDHNIQFPYDKRYVCIIPAISDIYIPVYNYVPGIPCTGIYLRFPGSVMLAEDMVFTCCCVFTITGAIVNRTKHC